MRIGLTYTGTPEKHENYVRWMKAGEEDVEVVRLSAEDGVADFDALVLSGGVDIHPSFYGGALAYEQSPSTGWKKERDEFESAMLSQSLASGKPVLGVCRGLQLINVHFGGTLVQDLGELGDEIHQNTPVDKEHAVMIEQGSLLHDISGEGGWINSAHHQAIDRLGAGLRVNARSGDGVIEGVEWASPAGSSWMLAVQWHPERMYLHEFADRTLYMNIRNQFIEAVKSNLLK